MDRIGQRIRRNVGTCQCATCKDVEQNGLIISDEQHAEYLFNCQMDRDSTGKSIARNTYRDTEEEVEEGVKCDSCGEYYDGISRDEGPDICEYCLD